MRRPRPLVLVIALGLALTLPACAKRPVGSQASAPAPGSAQSSSLAPGAGSTSAGAAPTGAGASGRTGASPAAPHAAMPARPPVPDFAENPALRDVFFDFDRYNIRPDAARTLESNATWLKSNPTAQVLIEGHCDERGTNEYNLALGERRARSTMNYLVSQGIQAARLTIISYGEERPTCREANEGCWSRNRRAHFLTRAR